MSRKDTNMRWGCWSRLLMSLLVLLCLCTLLTVVWLKQGIRLEQLSFGNTAIFGLQLTWRDKLELKIDTIHIATVEQSADTPGIPEQVYNGIEKGVMGAKLFSHLSVDTLILDTLDDTFTVVLNSGQHPWNARITSKNLMVEAEIAAPGDAGDGLLVDIRELKSNRLKTNGNGSLFIDFYKKNISGKLFLHLGQQIPVTLNISLDDERITFRGAEAGNIAAIDQFVDLFQLSPGIQRWITEYLQGSRYTLKSISGVIPWSDPGHLLHTLSAELRVENCSYTFAPGLEPITSRFTDVKFSNGVLTIIPNKATFYGQSTENSWLDINFTDPKNIGLTANISTHAIANKDIVNLLSCYHIPFPFRQLDGTTATNVSIYINLNKNKVDVAGTFHIDDSTIQYLSQEFDVANAILSLEGGTIEIKSLEVQLEDLLEASVTGIINLPEEQGELGVTLKRLSHDVDGYNLSLVEDEVGVAIDIHPKKHTMRADRSNWLFGPITMELSQVEAVLDIDNLTLALSPFEVSSPFGFTSQVVGSLSLLDQKASIQCALTSFDTDTLQLSDGVLPLQTNFDKLLRITADQESSWVLEDIPFTLGKTQVDYENGVASLDIERIQYGTLLESKISTTYDFKDQRGTLSLAELSVMDIDLGEVKADLIGTKDTLGVHFSDLEASFTIGTDKKFTASFLDLTTLGSHVKILQDIGIEEGSLDITSGHNGAPYSFETFFHSSLPILLIDRKPVDQYAIAGTVANGTLKAELNKEVEIEIGKTNHVFSDGVSYNLPELVSLIKKISATFSSGEKASKKPHFSLEAIDSGILLHPGTRAPADRIHLAHRDTTTIELEHDSGTVSIEIVDGQFLLEGKNLNHIFMSELSTEADYYQGNMSVVAQGSVEEFSALVKINDVILEKFTTLNNILAFLNTIPALATFSLPEYDTEGLPITSIVAGFVVKDDLVKIKSIDLDSPQFTMSGTGWINLREKTMDMDFNLITQAKKNIGKIPLLGYIIVGEEKRPSVTIKAKGNVSDPEVNLTLFKEISTMPISVLYRTLTLPYKMIESVIDTPNSDISPPEEGDASGQ